MYDENKLKLIELQPDTDRQYCSQPGAGVTLSLNSLELYYL